MIASKTTAKNSKNLSNADFRKHLAQRLVETQEYRKKKKELLADDTDEVGVGNAGSRGSGQKKSSKRLESYKRWKEKQRKKQEEQQDVVKYRDRAEERRKGKDSEFQYTEEELKKFQSLSYEQSKFLGGDMEHTHLVKGLDFALLAKKREELAAAEEAKFDEAVKGVEAKQPKARKEAQKKKEQEEKAVTFNSSLARSIYQWTKEQQEKREFFFYPFLSLDSLLSVTTVRAPTCTELLL